MEKIVGVLLPLPFDVPFDYKTDRDVVIGQIVEVPFGKDKQIGIIYNLQKNSDVAENKIKFISKYFEYPPLSAHLLQFIAWVAKYNMAPLGSVLKMVISVRSVFEPSPMTILYTLSGKTLAEAKLKNSDARWRVIDLLRHAPYTRQEIAKGANVTQSVIKTLIDGEVLKPVYVENKAEFLEPVGDYVKVDLTAEQQNAADLLCKKTECGFSVTLLDGVTGSGKTEVYFEAVAKTLEKGKQVLILVPEISLTTQWLNRFQKRFGVRPANWHSGLTIKERTDTWKAIIEGRVKVIVGARSALFLPYTNLGLIVIDESHDHSFKQEDVVNYQGRDMAIVRAKIEQFPLILSTATPDLETLVNVEDGKYDCVKLQSRYANATLPDIKIIDLKKDKPQKGEWGISWLAPSLVEALNNNLQSGEQSVLFLNRRGYAPLLICRDCGHRMQCPSCSAWLTEHKNAGKLMCHHCGYVDEIPSVCPHCMSADGLTACGPGVERIAEEVTHRFPQAKIDILSSDNATSFTAVSKIIAKMERREIDILIGTQIIAKGHHFPDLTLVGVVDADLGLMSSDLRAAEQTYQLLSQVAGRAGRGDKKGTVYVQTLHPENNVLKALLDNDRNEFMEFEQYSRRLLGYPPYGKLAALIISGANQQQTANVAAALGKTAPHTDNVSVLGPAPAPLYLLRDKYRFRLLLKTTRNINIQQVLREWCAMVHIPSSVRVEIDIDPYSFM
ncbi:MAG: primosomal protein N' [Alphaproteobacteria bacterium]|nr:primosomal protein N' [Alphaproteobacteria bacterium]